MIRVTVELISALAPERSKILGVAEIDNDLKTSLATNGQQGSYNVSLSKWAPKTKETWRRGKVENFDRKTHGAWDLLYLALTACNIAERNGHVIQHYQESNKKTKT